MVILIFLLTCGNIKNYNPYPLEGKQDCIPYSGPHNGRKWTYLSLPGRWLQFSVFHFPVAANPEALEEYEVFYDKERLSAWVWGTELPTNLLRAYGAAEM